MTIGFRGQIYAKTDTAVSNAVRRFETTSLKLSRCIIQVQVNPQSFGVATVYPVYYATDSKFEMINVDLSTLYFANTTTDAHGIASILGIYAD